MNKYKIKSIEYDAFLGKVTTAKGCVLHLRYNLVRDAKVGDTVREYVDNSFLKLPVAYSCNGKFCLHWEPRTDYFLQCMVKDEMSCMERARMNMAMMRALIKKGIMPSLSAVNNLRLILASNRVIIR